MLYRNPWSPAIVGPLRCLCLRIRCWLRRHPRWTRWLWVVIYAVMAVLGVCAGIALGAEEYRTFRVTAYCTCKKCCGKDPWHPAYGITASGTRADHPLVAAPRSFPFGTAMSIPGYAGGRWVRVEDRGGVIKGNRLDVLFAPPWHLRHNKKAIEKAHNAALQWGVRRLKVRIGKKGESDEQETG